MRENRLINIWNSGKTAVNGWLTIPASWSAEILAHAGFDSITIDLQHGLVDYQTALTMLQAVSTTGTVPMARVPWNDPGIIMRLLDAGAYGIICPMINRGADAEAFVGACRYAPEGYRSYGPIRASVYAGEDYVSRANRTILAFAMVETAEALRNLDDIAGTKGLNGLYVGPYDLSMSLGLPKLADFGHPGLLRALDDILSSAKKYGLIAGIHCYAPDSVAMLSERGFRLITPTNDTALLRSGAEMIVSKTRHALE